MAKIVYASVAALGLLGAFFAGMQVGSPKGPENKSPIAELLRRGLDGEDYPVATIYGYGDRNYDVCREELATVLNEDLQGKGKPALFSCR